MGEIYFVRHAQASMGSDNYDQLSELGYQQARWLGQYFADRGLEFDHLAMGTLARHRQTAEAMADHWSLPETQLDAGLNEFDFQGLLKSYLLHHPDVQPPDRKDLRQIFSLLRKAMLAWSRDELSLELKEPYGDFSRRVADALERIRTAAPRRALVVTSGGPISMTLKHIMGFDDETVVGMNLQSRNTGINEVYFDQRVTYVTSFNHVPHLDLPERRTAITHA